MSELTPLRRMQLAELEIAKRFVAFCDEHELRYFMLGGTFLGAVRHKGFVPWDDDMDFGMYREDYERFLQLCRTEHVPFEVHNFFLDKTDLNHYRYFTRIEDPAVTVHRRFAQEEETSGVWIDILPLDGMPDRAAQRYVRKYYLLWRKATYKYSAFSVLVCVDKPNRPFVERVLVAAGRVLPVERIFKFQREMEKLDRALKRYPPSDSNYVFQAISPYKLRELYKKEVFGQGRLYTFEGMRLRGPQNADGYLGQLYGDYMTLPPESKRNWHQREEIIFAEEAQRSKEKECAAMIDHKKKVGGVILPRYKLYTAGSKPFWGRAAA